MARWIPTRDEGLRRLQNFLPRAGRSYAKLRNYDLGPDNHEHVSTLSPWIRHRLILEEEVVSAVLGRHSFSAAEKFIQEVFWRTYWKGWLELRPSVWSDYCDRVEALLDAMDRNTNLRDRWEEATAGRTGIACFDGWSDELVRTGYLHNHARMWFASIWIFTLELPWELGADFFLRHLIDGDPASNTLSWRWVAGLQTRGKTYLARPDNIEKFTGGRYKLENSLATSAQPLDGPALPAPLAPPQHVQWDQDPQTGLLLTEEDLNPDFLLTGDVPITAVATMTATGSRSPLGVATPVLEFVAGAIGDSSARIEGQLSGTAEPVHAVDQTDPIVDWAREHGLKQLVTAYVPVGPTVVAMRELSDRLADHGIALVRALREWDHAAWPHATRGFFPFRQKIPSFLDEKRKAEKPIW